MSEQEFKAAIRKAFEVGMDFGQMQENAIQYRTIPAFSKASAFHELWADPKVSKCLASIRKGGECGVPKL